METIKLHTQKMLLFFLVMNNRNQFTLTSEVMLYIFLAVFCLYSNMNAIEAAPKPAPKAAPQDYHFHLEPKSIGIGTVKKIGG